MVVITAEKPSVAAEYAKAVGAKNKEEGYWEGNGHIVTWCIGHLVTLSYPEEYDPALKKWTLEALPFLPEKYLYEVIGRTKKQFGIVKKIITGMKPGDTLINGGDSGREGE